jgi:pyridoxine 5'-phosphate synthase PdxJ
MMGVELNCGAYALAAGERAVTRRLEAIRLAAGSAKRAQMKVFARGGIDRNNVASIAAIADIDEIRVGHAFVADCLFFGIERSFGQWITALDGVDRT